MDIRSIEIGHYKNLHECKIDLGACGALAVLAGINGSGKSNFLESVALVFHKLIGYGGDASGLHDCKVDCRIGGERCRLELDGGHLMFNGKLADNKGLSKARMVVVYSGEFGRLLQLGFDRDKDAEISVNGIVYVTGTSFPLMLLTRVLMDKDRSSGKYPSDLVLLPKAAAIEFVLAPPSAISSEPPSSAIEAILLKLSARAGGKLAIFNMPIGEFVTLVEECIPEWPELDGGTKYFILSQLAEESKSLPYLYDVKVMFEGENGNQYPSDCLSEGEKWLVMFDTIYRYFADENTLIVLDEPDAYIHESRKREFLQYAQHFARHGVFTMMTTHSPAIINTVHENSLFVFNRGKDGIVKVTNSKDRGLMRGLVDDKMSYVSSKPIVLFEGVSDIRLIRGALSYFAYNEIGFEDLLVTGDFDFFAMGSAGNAVEAYQCFKKAFPSRRIYVFLDHDDAGKKALTRLNEGGADGSSFLTDGDMAFLLPKPDQMSDDEKVYVMEDYLPKEYIQERLEQYKNEATCFHKVNNSSASLKTEIFKRCSEFGEREWRGFAPLVNFLKNLPR